MPRFGTGKQRDYKLGRSSKDGQAAKVGCFGNFVRIGGGAVAQGGVAAVQVEVEVV